MILVCVRTVHVMYSTVCMYYVCIVLYVIDSVSSVQCWQLHPVPRDPRGQELQRVPGRHRPTRHQRERRTRHAGWPRGTCKILFMC